MGTDDVFCTQPRKKEIGCIHKIEKKYFWRFFTYENCFEYKTIIINKPFKKSLLRKLFKIFTSNCQFEATVFCFCYNKYKTMKQYTKNEDEQPKKRSIQ